MKLDSLFETNSYDSSQESPNITRAKSNQFNPMAMSSPIQNYAKFKDNNNYYEQAKTKSSKVNIANLDPLLKTLSGKLLKGLVITSGNDSTHMKGSKHYKNKAFDIGANSSDKKAYKTFKEMLKNPTYKKNLMASHNIQDIIDEGDHLHIEQMKMGGKIKKYNDGGVGTTSKTNTIGIASQLGQLGSSVIDSTNNLENPDVGKSTFSGALGGASTGLAIGANPLLVGATGGLSVPIGAALGAIVGAVGGNKKAKQAKDLFNNRQAGIQTDYLNNVKQSTQARLSAFPAKGSSSINYYKFGGIPQFRKGGVIDSLNFRSAHNIKSNKRYLLQYFLPKTKPKYEDGTEQPVTKYEAEKGEVILGNEVQGNATEISNGVHLVKGKTHDQKNPKSINGTGEDFTGGDFIFSNSISPDGKKTFAEYAKAIAIKNKPDERMKNSTDYIYLNTIQANKQIEQVKLEQLAQLQEAMKESTGTPTPQMKFGGLVRYAKGGKTKIDLEKEIEKYANEIQAEQIRIANNNGSGDTLNELVRAKNKLDIQLSQQPKSDTPKTTTNTSGKMLRYGELQRNERLAKEEANKKPNKVNYNFSDYFLYGKKTNNQNPIDYLLYGKKGKNKTTFIPYKDGSDTFQQKGFAGSRFMYDKGKKQFVNISKPATGTTKPAVEVKPPIVKPPIVDKNKGKQKPSFVKPPVINTTTTKKPVFNSITGKQPTLIPTNMAKIPNVGNMKDVVDNVINPKKENKTSFSDFMNTNGNNLMGLTSIGANYLTNRNNINKMNTDVNVALNEAPDYQYRQRNALANHDILGNIRQVNNAPFLNNGARQDVYGKILNTLNQSNEAEAQRKFEYNTGYLNAVNANKNQNNQMISAARNQQIQNQNQKRGLLSDNTNQLFQNLNTFQKEQQDLVTNKENMALLSSGFARQVGIAPELINSGFLAGQIQYDKYGKLIPKKLDNQKFGGLLRYNNG